MEPELLSSAGETTAFTLEGWMLSTAQRQLFRVVAGRWESNSHPYKPPPPLCKPSISHHPCWVTCVDFDICSWARQEGVLRGPPDPASCTMQPARLTHPSPTQNTLPILDQTWGL